MQEAVSLILTAKPPCNPLGYTYTGNYCFSKKMLFLFLKEIIQALSWVILCQNAFIHYAGITAHLLVMFTLITGLIKSYKRRELNTQKLTLDA